MNYGAFNNQITGGTALINGYLKAEGIIFFFRNL